MGANEKAIELKVCPFCGGKAKWARAAPYAQLECKDCGCSVGLCHTRDQAHEYWNRRTTDEKVKALVEATENYMSQFGQALAAYNIEFSSSQVDADEHLRTAIAAYRATCGTDRAVVDGMEKA